MVDSSMVKLMSKSNFSLLSSLQVVFKRVVNGAGGQKNKSQINQNMVYEDPVWKQEIFYMGPDRSK